MVRRTGGALLGLAVMLMALAGCVGSVKEETIEVKAANDPLHEPRLILERYAAGQPLGSEVMSYPNLVANVRKVDPPRADILEKGLADIQKAPASRSAKAKELLKQLAPSMK
jgi:hypothetical protein